MKERYVMIGSTQYKQFYLTNKQHRTLFPTRGKKWSDTYRYYLCDSDIQLVRLVNIPGKIIITLLFPFLLLINGLGNIGEMFRELGDIYFQFRRRKYVSETIYKTSGTYERVLKTLKPYHYGEK
jgi:hypothetical protein